MTDTGETSRPSALRRVRRILWAVVGVALVGLGATLAVKRADTPATPRAATATRPAIGGSFALTDPDGRTVTDETLKGKPFAIFFGFTRCPDVCPTTLNDLSMLHKQLGPGAERLNIVFVSVDPEQDGREDIKQYLTLFDAPIIGLTGTDEQLRQIAKVYRVFFEKVSQGDDDYTIDHTATVFLMDANGQFVSTIDMHESREVALEKLRRLVSRTA